MIFFVGQGIGDKAKIMTSQNQDNDFSKLKSPSFTSTSVLCFLLGFCVFIGSFFPSFFKTINISTLIQQVMLSSNLANPVSDFTQLVQTIHLLRVILVVIPILVSVFILGILFIYRKDKLKGVKSIGLALLIPGIIAFVFESVLYVALNSIQRIQNYSTFLGFSGISAEIVKMIIMQKGNVFLFYWGITAFGILTLGLVLILVARVLKR